MRSEVLELTFVALVLAASLPAEEPLRHRDLFDPHGREPVAEVHSGKATNPPVSGGFLNGSFEAGSTQPSQWTISAAPPYRTGGAADGERWARVNLQQNLSQRLTWDIPVLQSITVRLKVRSEFAGLSAPLYLEGSGSVAEVPFFIARDGVPVANEWATVQYPFTRLSGMTSLLVLLRSRAAEWWLDVDDLEMLLEGPDDRWSIVTLTEGESLSEDLAHSNRAVHYFVAGRGTGELILAEERFTVTNGSAEGSTTTSLTLAGAEEFFSHEWPSSPAGHAARLSVTGGSGGGSIAGLSRGWTSAWPETFEPVANSPTPTIRLAAAWPGQLDEASIAVFDAAEEVRAVIDTLQRDGDSAWIDWDGAALPAGDYLAEFRMQSAGGDEVRLRRSFQLVRGEAYPTASTPLPLDRFTSMAWIHFVSGPEDADIDTPEEAALLMQRLQEDGFHQVIILAPPERGTLIADAADAAGIPFVGGFLGTAVADHTVAGNQTFDPRGYVERLAIYDPWRSSPNFLGVLAQDEANLSTPLSNRVVRALPQMERAGYVPYATESGRDASRGVLTPAVFAHSYSSSFTTIVNEWENNWLSLANASGPRPFFPGLQGYSGIGFASSLTASETSLLLGSNLALGAKGYYTFMYTSLNTIGGVRTFQLNETPRTVAYREFNQRTEALGSLLMELPSVRRRPPQDGIYVRAVDDSQGREHLFVVNQRPTSRAAVTLTLSGPAALQDAESSETLPAAAVHEFTLPAGGWALYRIEDPAAELASAHGVALDAPLDPAAAIRTLPALTTPEANARSIAFSPDGRRLALATGFALRVLSLEAGNRGTVLVNRFRGNGTARLQWLANGDLVSGNSGWGLEVLREGSPGAFASSVLRGPMTAGGLEAIPLGASRWATTQFFMGISLLDLSTAEGVRLDHVFSRQYGYLSVHGPFADGSVLAMERVFGLTRFSFEGDSITEERLTPSATWDFSDMNGLRELATGSRDYGLFVHTLTSEGRIASTVRVDDPQLRNPEQTLWLGDDAFALWDAGFGIRFYRRDGEAWRPRGRLVVSGMTSAMDFLPPSTFAVGNSAARIDLFDVSAVLAPPATFWMLTAP